MKELFYFISAKYSHHSEVLYKTLVSNSKFNSKALYNRTVQISVGIGNCRQQNILLQNLSRAKRDTLANICKDVRSGKLKGVLLYFR